jgi:hypothetical protein
VDEEERVLQSELLVRKGLMQRRTYILDHLEPIKHVEFGHTEEIGVGGVLDVACDGNASPAELLDLQRPVPGREWLMGRIIDGIENPRLIFIKIPLEVRPNGRAP